MAGILKPKKAIHQGLPASASLKRLPIATVSVLLFVLSLGTPLDPEISLLMLACAGFITGLAGAYENKWKRSPLVAAVIAFLAATVLSVAGSVDVYRSYLISFSLLPAMLLFYMIVSGFGITRIDLLYRAFVLLGVLICTSALLTVWNNPHKNPSGWMAIIGNPYLLVPNDLTLLAIIAPASIVLMYRRSAPLDFSLSALSLVLSLSVIVLFQSRGALLVLIATSAFTMSLLWPRRFVAKVLLGILAIGILVDGLQGFLLLDKFMGVWGTRLPLWLAAWQMFLDAPVLGHGPNAFASIGERYVDLLVLPEWIPQDPRHVPWVHNLYLELLAERGLVGTLSFLGLLGIAWALTWRICRTDSAGDVQLYAKGVLAGLFGILIAGLFELSFIRLWFLIVFYLLLSIAQVLSTQQQNRGEIHSNEKTGR